MSPIVILQFFGAKSKSLADNIRRQQCTYQTGLVLICMKIWLHL